MPRKADNTYVPKGGEHVRHLDLSKDDRRKHNEEWKADRDHKLKIKEERFEAIRARRKKSGGSGDGIKITVDTDKK
jgi:hypothetical protein